jgi:hypothetical protein
MAENFSMISLFGKVIFLFYTVILSEGTDIPIIRLNRSMKHPFNRGPSFCIDLGLAVVGRSNESVTKSNQHAPWKKHLDWNSWDALQTSNCTSHPTIPSILA